MRNISLFCELDHYVISLYFSDRFPFFPGNLFLSDIVVGIDHFGLIARIIHIRNFEKRDTCRTALFSIRETYSGLTLPNFTELTLFPSLCNRLSSIPCSLVLYDSVQFFYDCWRYCSLKKLYCCDFRCKVMKIYVGCVSYSLFLA